MKIITKLIPPLLIVLCFNVIVLLVQNIFRFYVNMFALHIWSCVIFIIFFSVSLFTDYEERGLKKVI